jgi:hypothetical protein
MGKYFEVTGNLNKEETVHALTDYKLKNTFVVIADEPYPGYHYHKIDARMIEQNTAVFLVTRTRNTWASIIRATEKINKFLDEPIDASYANLFLFNVPHYSIRIMGLKNMEELETIQKAYQEEGFVFMKNKRMLKPRATFFKVKKFFNLKELEEGIYKNEEGMIYFTINRKIEWEMFRKMTLNVKSNISNNNYDVVDGSFYMNHKLVDFIRIYKPDCSLDLIKEIRGKYQKQIQKYF